MAAIRTNLRSKYNHMINHFIENKKKKPAISEDIAGSSRSAQSLLVLDGRLLGVLRGLGRGRRRGRDTLLPVLLGSELPLTEERVDGIHRLHARTADAHQLPDLSRVLIVHACLHRERRTVVTVDTIGAETADDVVLGRHLLRQVAERLGDLAGRVADLGVRADVLLARGAVGLDPQVPHEPLLLENLQLLLCALLQPKVHCSLLPLRVPWWRNCHLRPIMRYLKYSIVSYKCQA